VPALTGLNAACKNPRTEAQLYEGMLNRFSPSRLALVYVALSALVLGLFAIPLWYVWRVNYDLLVEQRRPSRASSTRARKEPTT